MSFYNELSDLFPCLSLRRPHYRHRLYEGYFYDDSVRDFLSKGHGHHVTGHIFAAQINMPWLRRYKRQIWSLIPISSQAAILKCKNRAGEVLYYSYLNGTYCQQFTQLEFVLDKYDLSIVSRPTRDLYKTGLGVSKAALLYFKTMLQVTEKQPTISRT